MCSVNKEVKVECEMNNKVLCGGCLSTDRKLKHLGIYSDLFSKLLDSDQDSKFYNTLLCWECMALLLRIERFQRRIHRAQATLQQVHFNKMVIPNESLSNLNIFNFNITDIYEKDNVILEPKNDTHTKNIKFEITNNNDSDNESRTENICNENENERVEHDINNENKRVGCDINNEKEGVEHDINNDNENKRVDDDIYNENDNEHMEHDIYNENDNERVEHVPNILEKPIEIEYTIQTRSKRKCVTESEKKKLKTNHKKIKNPKPSKKFEKKVEKTIITFSEAETEQYFFKIFITDEELQKYSEKKRGNKLNELHKCWKCLHGFVNKESLENHNKWNHSKGNVHYACDVCESHLPTKVELMEHLKTHLCIYQCTVCKRTLLHESEKLNHLQEFHCIGYKCMKCTAHFVVPRKCYKHYEKMHKNLVCDHCGSSFKTKRRIVAHIKCNHGDLVCEVCGRKHNRYSSLQNHYRLNHPFMISTDLKNESCYCVECDKHFISKYKYRSHLKATLKHTPRQKNNPCPECGKIFAKKYYVKYHMQVMHAKQTKHYCEICDKYFAFKCLLRGHIQRVHEKIALPKNKFCNICGRGFNTNKVLRHHMRTHTGERPYKCELCPAAFAQKTALKSHMKVHFKNIN